MVLETDEDATRADRREARRARFGEHQDVGTEGILDGSPRLLRALFRLLEQLAMVVVDPLGPARMRRLRRQDQRPGVHVSMAAETLPHRERVYTARFAPQSRGFANSSGAS